jgi:hypothetical protein
VGNFAQALGHCLRLAIDRLFLQAPAHLFFTSMSSSKFLTMPRDAPLPSHSADHVQPFPPSSHWPRARLRSVFRPFVFLALHHHPIEVGKTAAFLKTSILLKVFSLVSDQLVKAFFHLCFHLTSIMRSYVVERQHSLLCDVAPSRTAHCQGPTH